MKQVAEKTASCYHLLKFTAFFHPFDGTPYVRELREAQPLTRVAACSRRECPE